MRQRTRMEHKRLHAALAMTAFTIIGVVTCLLIYYIVK